jgi:hypothetical protein
MHLRQLHREEQKIGRISTEKVKIKFCRQTDIDTLRWNAVHRFGGQQSPKEKIANLLWLSAQA